jgi:hypothetical protein
MAEKPTNHILKYAIFYSTGMQDSKADGIQDDIFIIGPF